MTVPFADDTFSKFMEKQLKPADLLPGRKTYEIYASYWPKNADNWPGTNDVTKYVRSSTAEKSDWENTVFLKSLADIESLRNSIGSDIKVWGMSKLVQLLLKHDLADELWLHIHPLTLGRGKKLSDSGTIPAA